MLRFTKKEPEGAIPIKIEEIPKEEYFKPLEIRKVYEEFPLINLTLFGKKFSLAKGRIRWEPNTQWLIYEVIEPHLTTEEIFQLARIRDKMREEIDVEIGKIRKEILPYLVKKFQKIKKKLKIKTTVVQDAKLLYYIYRDFVGLGKIEPLMHDDNIEDISCDGVNIPVYVYHRNPAYGQMPTNIVFTSKEELDSFVFKLAQKCGRGISVANPILDGALPDGSRVHATLGSDIAMKGSNFTIRKFTRVPLTPIHLIKFGTATPELFAYLWLAVENGMSILVAGSTAVGKTTFLNCISMFIRPEAKIISIEDTPELKLPHENWIPEVARPGYGGVGEVSMFELLKAALRQRPDYIIVGEVRGKEAYVMFQGMATGHPGLGTLHADSVNAVIHRLTTEPINLPKSILTNLDIIVFLTMQRRRHVYVRRVKEVVEILGYDYKKDALSTNVAFEWDPANDIIRPHFSYILNKIREKMGLNVDQLKAELSIRAKLLEWLAKNDITNYKEVAKYIQMYYVNPKRVLEMVA